MIESIRITRYNGRLTKCVAYDSQDNPICELPIQGYEKFETVGDQPIVKLILHGSRVKVEG